MTKNDAHCKMCRFACACAVLMCCGCSAAIDAEHALWEGLNGAFNPVQGEALKLVSPFLNIPADDGDDRKDALKKKFYQLFEKTFLDGEGISVDLGEPGELSMLERYEAIIKNKTLLQDKACFVVLDDQAYEEGLSGDQAYEEGFSGQEEAIEKCGSAEWETKDVFTKYDRLHVFKPSVWNWGGWAKANAENQKRWLGSEYFMCDESLHSIGGQQVHPGFIPPVLVDMFDMMRLCNDEDDEVAMSTCVQEAFKDRIAPEEQEHLIAKVVSVLDCNITVVKWPIARMGLTRDVLSALEAANVQSAPYQFVNKVLTAFVKGPCPALHHKSNEPRLYLIGLVLKSVPGSIDHQEKAKSKLISDLGFRKTCEPTEDGDYLLHRAVTEQFKPARSEVLKLVSPLLNIPADGKCKEKDALKKKLYRYFEKTHFDREGISVDLGKLGEPSLVERYEAMKGERQLSSIEACFVVLDDTAYEEGLSQSAVFTKYDHVNVFRPRRQTSWGRGGKDMMRNKAMLVSRYLMCDESFQSIGGRQVHPGFIPPILVDMFDMMRLCNDEDDEVAMSTCVQEAFKDRIPPEEQEHLIAKVVSVPECNITVVKWPIARMGLTRDVLRALEVGNMQSAPYQFVNKVLTAFVEGPCPALQHKSNEPKLYLMGVLLQTVQGSIENQEKAQIKFIGDLGGYEKVVMPNKDGDYILHQMIGEQQGVPVLGDLRTLVQYRANLEARDRQGATPLLRAMQEGRPDFTLFLMLEARSDVNAIDNSGQGALGYAARYLQSTGGEGARRKLDERLLETLTGDGLEKAKRRVEDDLLAEARRSYEEAGKAQAKLSALKKERAELDAQIEDQQNVVFTAERVVARLPIFYIGLHSSPTMKKRSL